MRLFFLQKFHFLYILYNVLKGGRLFRVLRTKQKRGPKNARNVTAKEEEPKKKLRKKKNRLLPH